MNRLPKNPNWKRFFEFNYYHRLFSFHYLRLIPFLKNTTNGEERTNINNWVKSLLGYQKIIVVGCGPSVKLVEYSKDYIYITTNAGITLFSDYDVVYYLNDLYSSYKTLKQGIDRCNCRGVVFRQEFPTNNQRSIEFTKNIVKYKQKYKRNYPEILLTNYANPCYDLVHFNQNYELVNRYIKTHLGREFIQINSGFGLLYLGYFIAHKLSLPLVIYGLDAGVGGKVHFDGAVAHKTVFGDNIKRELSALLKTLYNQQDITVKNFSYFMPSSANTE